MAACAYPGVAKRGNDLRVGDPNRRLAAHVRVGLPHSRPLEDPDYDPCRHVSGTTYTCTTGAVDSFHYAAHPAAAMASGKRSGGYRKHRPRVLDETTWFRLAVEKRGEEYLSFPGARCCLTNSAMRTMVLETEPVRGTS